MNWPWKKKAPQMAAPATFIPVGPDDLVIVHGHRRFMFDEVEAARSAWLEGTASGLLFLDSRLAITVLQGGRKRVLPLSKEEA